MSNYCLSRKAGLVIMAGLLSLTITETAFARDLPPIGCEASEKIDGSSATQARQKIAAAGYLKVHGLKKGCDSFWHGEATKDGNPTHVSLSPQGVVLSEGN